MHRNKQPTPVLGWREWVSLPGLHVDQIKAKIDTGARTSCLHAYDIKEYKKGRKTFVKFKIHPLQRDDEFILSAKAELIDKRKIKDSGGTVTIRPVIRTTVECGDYRWDIELTLIGRDQMGFRMLLGRQGVRGKFLINPGKSYLLGDAKEPT